MSVAIVTDSTASLPAQVVAQLGIQVVALQVKIGRDVNTEDRVERSDLITALRQQVPVATAEPPSAAFFWTYQDAADAGAREVVSIHISGRLSATCESARAAAERAHIPVHVVDSQTSGMSLGLLTIAAARAARGGRSAADIVRLVTARQRQGDQLIYVDTLEHLRRGGRIGAASAFLGTALSIKPLLAVAGGEIVPLTRVRGTRRALDRLVDIARTRSAGRAVDAAIEHVDAPDRAAELAHLLGARMPATPQPLVTSSSAVLAAHLGPGAVGLSLAPA